MAKKIKKAFGLAMAMELSEELKAPAEKHGALVALAKLGIPNLVTPQGNRAMADLIKKIDGSEEEIAVNLDVIARLEAESEKIGAGIRAMKIEVNKTANNVREWGEKEK